MYEIVIMTVIILILLIVLIITLLTFRYIILPFISVICYIVWEYSRLNTNFKAWQNKQQFEKRVDKILKTKKLKKLK